LLPALAVLAGLFCALFFLRLGGARRGVLEYRWPAVLFAVAALVAASRAAIWPAIGLSAAALLAWFLAPALLSPRPSGSAQGQSQETPAEIEARTILGVGRGASEAEIRRAYRIKMRSAHPDRGGRHADAAQLTAARDLLLKSKR
jgi:hypothetical protein